MHSTEDIPKSIGDLTRGHVDRIAAKYGRQEAEALVTRVVDHYTGWSRLDVAMHPERSIAAPTARSIENAIVLLQDHHPIQYVLGSTSFDGHLFKTDPRALIPRPETEELVHLIKEREAMTTGGQVWDVGTGSGCIAISLQKRWPKAKVVGLDKSTEALELAKENADALGAPVEWLIWDFMSDQPPSIGPVDLIVSNPPYVCESEKAAMRENVLNFEPHQALFVPDQDPLCCYRSIAESGKRLLNPGGRMYFEINARWGNDLVVLLQSMDYCDIHLQKDMYGKDRFILAQK